MKTTNTTKEKNVRTWIFAAGATFLLAVLTVLLCFMGGVFDFSPSSATPSPEQTQGLPNTQTTPQPQQTPQATPEQTPEPQMWGISALAGTGGSISPSGTSQVEAGGSLTYTITPDPGYELSALQVDGSPVEAGNTYTFTDVQADHSIYAVFRLAPGQNTATPRDAPPPASTPEGPTAATNQA